jgi:hypothetical protein
MDSQEEFHGAAMQGVGAPRNWGKQDCIRARPPPTDQGFPLEFQIDRLGTGLNGDPGKRGRCWGGVVAAAQLVCPAESVTFFGALWKWRCGSDAARAGFLIVSANSLQR